MSHLLFWVLLWPGTSLLFSIFWLREQTLLSGAPYRLLLAGAAAAFGRLVIEFLVVGSIGLLLSFTTFSVLTGSSGRDERTEWRYLLEPVCAFLALSSGVILVYPAVLRQPLFSVVHPTTVTFGTAIVLLTTLGLAALTGKVIRGVAAALIVWVTFLSLGWGLAARRADTAEPGSGGIFLICLDSMSIPMGLERLEAAVVRNGGEWYRGAVAPGLLTNSTWTAILRNEPVPETGVYMVFQQGDWGPQSGSLVRDASRRGYYTISWFTGQFTVYVGSEAGFEADLSGPKGWLQAPTAALKDVSILLPLVLRALPAIPGAGTPPNQSGTFAYDLDLDLSTIAGLGGEVDRPVFVAAHLDYLHAPTFPGYPDLAAEEKRSVRSARIESLMDQSLDWQYPEVVGDPIDIEHWKLRNLERAVADMIDRSRLTDPELRNRVIIFSDHGNRTGIDNRNFAQPRYFNVPFATFNVPVLSTSKPLSLLEIGYLSGLAPPTHPPAIVAYTNVEDQDEWAAFERTANMLPDGTVRLDHRLLTELGSRLRCFEPGIRQTYWDCPTTPAVLP